MNHTPYARRLVRLVVRFDRMPQDREALIEALFVLRRANEIIPSSQPAPIHQNYRPRLATPTAERASRSVA
jgi:hypothetical protein